MMLNAAPIRIRRPLVYVVLGVITPQQAAQQAAALSRAYNASSQMANLQDFAQAGMINTSTPGYQYTPGAGECSGQPAPNLSLFIKGSQLALGVAGAGVGVAAATGAIAAATSAIFGAVTLGIGSIVGVFTIFEQHHAQAVAKEQSTLCSAVPAANNYLQVIQQAVQSGAATPQQAIAALNSLLSDFKSAVSSILKMDSSHCNAACYLVIALTAIVNYQTSVYQDMAAAGVTAAPVPQIGAPSTSVPPATVIPATRSNSGAGPTTAAPATGSTLQIPPATSPSSLPSWLPIAAVIGLGFLAVRAL